MKNGLRGSPGPNDRIGVGIGVTPQSALCLLFITPTKEENQHGTQ